MGYVFDGIDIYSAAGVLEVSFDRPVGPIEQGSLDSAGNWAAAAGAEQVRVSGFGVDPDDNPYYDSVAVDPGDEATLFCDPSRGAVAGSFWLERV